MQGQMAANSIVTLFGSITIAAAILVCAFIYILSRVRKNDIDTLRGSNDDLRNAVKDKTDEITSLRADLQSLSLRLTELETHNRTLEDLVITALKQYFFQHPDVAGGVGNKILPNPNSDNTTTVTTRTQKRDNRREIVIKT